MHRQTNLVRAKVILLYNNIIWLLKNAKIKVFIINNNNIKKFCKKRLVAYRYLNYNKQVKFIKCSNALQNT